MSGIVAIGHSGLTGYGAGGLDFSWATGDDPSVDSIWLRVHDADQALAGDAVNRAVNGTKSDVLAQQMQLAFKADATPALVIISTVDNDVRCDGTDDAHVPELGANVAKALALIAKQSPGTQIVVVGEPGRPSIPFLRNLVAKAPARARAFEGTGPCALLDLSGRPLPRHVARLTRIINAYEAEEARVCAAVPNCRTDGGTRAAYVNRIENFATDLSHLNRIGQAAEAALLWPVVEQALGL